MPQQQITDLDVLVPADKTVLFKGRKYVLPGDMPLETYLKVNRLGNEQDDGATPAELVGEMVDGIVALFTRPDLWPANQGEVADAREVLRGQLMGLGFETVTQFLGKIYPADEADEPAAGEVVEADAADPQTPTAGATTTTT